MLRFRKSITTLAATAAAVPAIAAMTAAAALPARAAEVDIQTSGPVVELQVMQQVLGDPDKATVSAGVTTRAPTAQAAMQQNAAEMERVLQRLDALGIDRRYVQTSGISLNPQYDYRNNEQPRFTGYEASNIVTIELRDIDAVGGTLDALVESGATNISGPSWGIVDDSNAQAQARKAAFDQAMAQARDYARMAGFGDVRLLAVSESMSMAMPMQDRAVMVQAAMPAPKTPTRPGQVATQVTLSATFELVR
ncbi:SIMPL domain-containing protein [Croceicoccus marinus]|nr:SIMPL domain-containing protein [Croceicoccus marinus]